MPRIPKFTPGPSRLSRILQNLTRGHRPVIAQLKTLKLTLAARNDHWGARHFIAEELPRIRYANPEAEIEVNKVPKSPGDNLKPEMVVEMRNGEKHTFNLSDKHSTSILTDLMDKFGGSPWARWKHQRGEAGLPLIEPPVPVPTKLEIKAEALGPKIKKVPGLAKKLAGKTKTPKKSKSEDKGGMDYDSLFDPKKTGAGAVLP